MELFKIDAQAFAAFQLDARGKFQVKGRDYLRQRFPEKWEPASDAEVNQFLLDTEGKAAKYELTSEQAVMAVADIRCRIGDDWTSAKWDFIPKMLSDKEYDPSFRALLAAQCVQDLTDSENPR